MRYKSLASKSLPDGTILTAIDWGRHVILLHQQIVDVMSYTPDKYPRFNRPGMRVQIELYTLATRLITRQEFDNMQADYEQGLKDDPQLAAPPPKLTGPSS